MLRLYEHPFSPYAVKVKIALREKGVPFEPVQPQRDASGGVLAGKTFVFTGELASLTRGEAQAKVRELGGKETSSVSAKTSYVVAGSEPGSKYDKAKKLGVTILTGTPLLELTTHGLQKSGFGGVNRTPVTFAIGFRPA